MKMASLYICGLLYGETIIMYLSFHRDIFCIMYGGIRVRTAILVETELYIFFQSYCSLYDNYKKTIISLQSEVL